MRRGVKLGFAFLGMSSLVAAYALMSGILIGATIEWRGTGDFQANRIINHAIRKCWYLYPSGVVEREA
jgi:hypothetical protein